MKVYHYSGLDDWPSIEHGSYIGDHVPGLGANKRLGRSYGPAWETGAVFCLTDPAPDVWVNNRQFPTTWNRLMANVGRVLLEVDTTGLENHVKVIDYGYKEATIPGVKKGRYASKSQYEAEEKYFLSAVDLAEFVADSVLQDGYSLPEVIITEHVPLANISFASDQSRLIESVQGWRGDWREHMEWQISRIPALCALVPELEITPVYPEQDVLV